MSDGQRAPIFLWGFAYGLLFRALVAALFWAGLLVLDPWASSIAVAAVLLAAFVLAYRRFERSAPPARRSVWVMRGLAGLVGGYLLVGLLWMVGSIVLSDMDALPKLVAVAIALAAGLVFLALPVWLFRRRLLVDA